MDDLEQLGELARSVVLSPRPAPSTRELRRNKRALWALALGILSGAIGLFYLTRSSGPSGGGAPGTFPAMPSLWQIARGLAVAAVNVLGGLGAIALGLSAVHGEKGRYSLAALAAVVLGGTGLLGLIILMLS